MSINTKNEIPKSLAVLGSAVVLGVTMALILSSAPAPGGSALALSTRCTGGTDGGGGGTPTPSATPTETEDPDPIPTLPPIGGEETETPTASPTGSPTSTDGPSGEQRRCNSEITIRHDSDRQLFSGAVRSDEAACKRGRRVNLKLDRDGRDRTVETTTTTRRGKWKAAFPNPRGRRFYAVVTKSSTPRLVCLPAKSRTIRAQNPS